MKVTREIVGAESVLVVSRPVPIPGFFLLLWLMFWTTGIVSFAHHILSGKPGGSSGLLSGLPEWLQNSIIMTALVAIWFAALWGILLSFFGRSEIRLGAKWGECFTGVGRLGHKRRFRVEPGSKLMLEKRIVEYGRGRPSGPVYCVVLRNYVEKDLHLLDSYDLGECKELQSALVEANGDLEAVFLPPDYTEEMPNFKFKGKVKLARKRRSNGSGIR